LANKLTGETEMSRCVTTKLAIHEQHHDGGETDGDGDGDGTCG
jgi:hypothetical protein